MSQVYSTEPQTAGRVIFETTHGPLEIQLWSRECPGTTKFFLQLCLDGFYENVLFHRIVPNFLLQTGALRYDPVARTSSQKTQVTSLDHNDWRDYRARSQAEQAMERRQFELNTRIRFNHRGQVAMALPVASEGIGEDEMAIMQPQFFITLDEATELDGKHVCFGTVTGPTVFNALRIGNTDVDEHTGQPNILEEAPRIERVKILENPIHTDLVPSTGILPWTKHGVSGGGATRKDKKKRKAIKNVNVLSFGNELEQDLGDGARGIRSSHDLVESRRLSKKVDMRVLEAVTTKKDDSRPKEDDPDDPPRSKKSKSSEHREINAATREIEADVNNDGNLPDDEPESYRQAIVSYTTSSQRTKAPTRSPDKKIEGVPANAVVKVPKVSLVEARRGKYAKLGSKDKKQREEDTMAKFAAFQSKISSKKELPNHQGDAADDDDHGVVSRMIRRNEKGDDDPEQAPGQQMGVVYHGQILDNDDDAEADWIRTKFKCRKHQDLDAKLGGDGRDAMEDYKVIDEKDRPRQPRKGGDKQRHHKHSKKQDSLHAHHIK